MNNKNRKFKGFTLVELMMVIAIVGILSAVSFVGAAAQQNRIKQTGRDKTAEILYTSAQARLTQIHALGKADELVVPSAVSPIRNDVNSGYYFLKDTDAGSSAFSIFDSAATFGGAEGNGHWIIEYHAETCTVLNAFYTEDDTMDLSSVVTSGAGSIIDADSDAYRMSVRVGWYGGDSPRNGVPRQVGSVIADVQIFNEEYLYAKLALTIPHSLVETAANSTPTITTVDEVYHALDAADNKAEFEVTVEDAVTGAKPASASRYTFNDVASKTAALNVMDVDGLKPSVAYDSDTEQITVTWYMLLDSLDNPIGSSFSYITPGNDIYLKLEADGGSTNSIPSVMDYDQANSLFAYADTGVNKVYVQYGRHLQNLNNTSSGYLPAADMTVIQVSDIDFNKTGNDMTADVKFPSWMDTYKDASGSQRKFVPIVNLNKLKVYDGQKYAISNMVTDASKSQNKNAGLFDTFFGTSLKQIRIKNAVVEATEAGTAAGALAGVIKATGSSETLTISDVQVSGSTVAAAGKAGGVAGDITSEGGFSAEQVYSVKNTVSGSGYAGGIAGAVTVNGSTADFSDIQLVNTDKEVISGVGAGGIAGSLTGGSSTVVTVDGSGAVGTAVRGTTGAAGGLFGEISNSGGTTAVTASRVYLRTAAETSDASDLGTLKANVSALGPDIAGGIDANSEDSSDSYVPFITGSTNVGGLVGTSTGTLSITDSFAATVVKATGASSCAGGLAGSVTGTLGVDHSYADCYIHGTTSIGGLAGSCANGSTFADCYSAGFQIGIGATTAAGFAPCDSAVITNAYTVFDFDDVTAWTTTDLDLTAMDPDGRVPFVDKGTALNYPSVAVHASTYYGMVKSATAASTNAYYTYSLVQGSPVGSKVEKITAGELVAGKKFDESPLFDGGSSFVLAGEASNNTNAYRLACVFSPNDVNMSSYPFPHLNDSKRNNTVHYGDWLTTDTKALEIYYVFYDKTLTELTSVEKVPAGIIMADDTKRLQNTSEPGYDYEFDIGERLYRNIQDNNTDRRGYRFVGWFDPDSIETKIESEEGDEWLLPELNKTYTAIDRTKKLDYKSGTDHNTLLLKTEDNQSVIDRNRIYAVYRRIEPRKIPISYCYYEQPADSEGNALETDSRNSLAKIYDDTGIYNLAQQDVIEVSDEFYDTDRSDKNNIDEEIDEDKIIEILITEGYMPESVTSLSDWNGLSADDQEKYMAEALRQRGLKSVTLVDVKGYTVYGEAAEINDPDSTAKYRMTPKVKMSAIGEGETEQNAEGTTISSNYPVYSMIRINRDSDVAKTIFRETELIGTDRVLTTTDIEKMTEDERKEFNEGNTVTHKEWKATVETDKNYEYVVLYRDKVMNYRLQCVFHNSEYDETNERYNAGTNGVKKTQNDEDATIWTDNHDDYTSKDAIQHVVDDETKPVSSEKKQFVANLAKIGVYGTSATAAASNPPSFTGFVRSKVENQFIGEDRLVIFHYVRNSHSLTRDLNDGKYNGNSFLSMKEPYYGEDLSASGEDYLSLDSDKYSRAGYKFAGWKFYKADGTDTGYGLLFGDYNIATYYSKYGMLKGRQAKMPDYDLVALAIWDYDVQSVRVELYYESRYDQVDLTPTDKKYDFFDSVSFSSSEFSDFKSLMGITATTSNSAAVESVMGMTSKTLSDGKLDKLVKERNRSKKLEIADNHVLASTNRGTTTYSYSDLFVLANDSIDDGDDADQAVKLYGMPQIDNNGVLVIGLYYDRSPFEFQFYFMTQGKYEKRRYEYSATNGKTYLSKWTNTNGSYTSNEWNDFKSSDYVKTMSSIDGFKQAIDEFTGGNSSKGSIDNYTQVVFDHNNNSIEREIAEDWEYDKWGYNFDQGVKAYYRRTVYTVSSTMSYRMIFRGLYRNPLSSSLWPTYKRDSWYNVGTGLHQIPLDKFDDSNQLGWNYAKLILSSDAGSDRTIRLYTEPLPGEAGARGNAGTTLDITDVSSFKSSSTKELNAAGSLKVYDITNNGLIERIFIEGFQFVNHTYNSSDDGPGDSTMMGITDMADDEYPYTKGLDEDQDNRRWMLNTSRTEYKYYDMFFRRNAYQIHYIDIDETAWANKIKEVYDAGDEDDDSDDLTYKYKYDTILYKGYIDKLPSKDEIVRPSSLGSEYNFAGWYTSSSYDTKVADDNGDFDEDYLAGLSSDQKGTNTAGKTVLLMDAADMTFFARWSADYVTLKFDAQYPNPDDPSKSAANYLQSDLETGIEMGKTYKKDLPVPEGNLPVFSDGRTSALDSIDGDIVYSVMNLSGTVTQKYIFEGWFIYNGTEEIPLRSALQSQFLSTTMVTAKADGTKEMTVYGRWKQDFGKAGYTVICLSDDDRSVELLRYVVPATDENAGTINENCKVYAPTAADYPELTGYYPTMVRQEKTVTDDLVYEFYYKQGEAWNYDVNYYIKVGEKNILVYSDQGDYLTTSSLIASVTGVAPDGYVISDAATKEVQRDTKIDPITNTTTAKPTTAFYVAIKESDISLAGTTWIEGNRADDAGTLLTYVGLASDGMLTWIDETYVGKVVYAVVKDGETETTLYTEGSLNNIAAGTYIVTPKLCAYGKGTDESIDIVWTGTSSVTVIVKPRYYTLTVSDTVNDGEGGTETLIAKIYYYYSTTDGEQGYYFDGLSGDTFTANVDNKFLSLDKIKNLTAAEDSNAEKLRKIVMARNIGSYYDILCLGDKDLSDKDGKMINAEISADGELKWRDYLVKDADIVADDETVTAKDLIYIPNLDVYADKDSNFYKKQPDGKFKATDSVYG